MKRAQEEWKHDIAYDPKGHRVIRGRRDLHYDPKGHGDLCGRFDLVYDPKRSRGRRGFKPRIRPPYSQRVVKGDLMGR